MNLDPLSVTIFFLSGLFPALVWLWFWIREDKEHPEPKYMIALAFFGGMVATLIALFFENYLSELGFKNLVASSIFSNILPWFETVAKQASITQARIFTVNDSLLVIIFAPIIEEPIKFIMAYITALRSKFNDEPLDPMVYMITTALGFAAVENMLFLISSWNENHSIISSLSTGNMRFIGPTLIHTISSAIIAMFISFNFFNNRAKKIFFTLLGIICSVIIHGILNFFIFKNQETSIMALELIWIAVIIILLAFEKIKKIGKLKLSNN